jgi:hypothetical protein
MSTRLAIIDEALVSIGALPLQAETAPGAESRIAEYDTVVAAILSGYPWTFSTPTRRLTRLALTPPVAWRYAYARPVEMIGAPRAAYDQADCRQPFFAWELIVIIDGEGHKVPVLATDAEQVWLTFTSSIDPQWWPGYLKQVIVEALKAQYALSVREDRQLAERLKAAVYGSTATPGELGLLGHARNMDASAKPSSVLGQALTGNPLIMARQGASTWPHARS